MANNEIKIIIGGDPSGFTDAAREAGAATNRLRNSMKDAAGAIPAFNSAAGKAGDTLKSRIVPGANQAAGALLGMNRVIQDAPFGFVAIQNNITELPRAFESLSAAAKESGQSIGKLLLTSLTGPAGIGVAISVITAAITFATVGFGAWTRGIKSGTEAIDKHKKEIDDFIKSLKSVEETSKEAAASQEGQIAQVQALASAVSDSNVPYAQRKRALENLKEINKSYFGDLQLEDAATGKLARTVNQYADALVNAAIQKEFANDIAQIAKEVVKQDAIISASRSKVAQAQTEVNKAQERTKGSFTEEQISTNAQVGAKAIENLTKAQEDLGKENAKVTDLLVQEALIRDQLNKAVLEGSKLKKLSTEGDKKEEDALKKRLEALQKIQEATKDATSRVGLQELIFDLQVRIAVRDQGKNRLSKSEVDQQIQGFQKDLQKEFDNQAIELELTPKAHFSQVVRADISTKEIQSEVAKATGLDKKIPIPTQFEIDLRLFGPEFAKNMQAARDQAAAITQTLTESIANGIADASGLIGDAFANVLSGEDIGASLANAAQGILGIVGGILQQIGRQIIITSKLVAALKKAINGLFKPGGELIGIAVGAALIATGALLKGFKFDVPKFADGGLVNSPTLGIFGERGPEVITPLRKLPGIINDTLKLSLPQLLGNINVNNQQPIVFNGGFRVSGTDLSLMLERVQSRRSRLG